MEDAQKSKKIYKDLRDEVMKAKAHARFMAESKMRSEDPKTWLIHGPGKETEVDKGWSRAATPTKITNANKTINIHNHPLVADLITQILTALEDHQEARLKVAYMIGIMKPNPKKPFRIEADYEAMYWSFSTGRNYHGQAGLLEVATDWRQPGPPGRAGIMRSTADPVE